MNRKESYVIGSVLAVMIPILLVACCWFCIITAMMVESLRIGYSRIVGVVFVLVLCSLLMIVQYWLTRGSAILAYRGCTKYQK